MKYLSRVPIESSRGENKGSDLEVTRPPSNIELMNKINEIIRELNRREQKELHRPPKLTKWR